MTEKDMNIFDGLIAEYELRAKYNDCQRDYETYSMLVNAREYLCKNVHEDMASAVGLFIAQCGEMAEQNWCPSQVDMLQRLFGAVLNCVEYSDYDIGGEE